MNIPAGTPIFKVYLDAMNRAALQEEFVVSGLAPAAGSGLVVNIGPGISHANAVEFELIAAATPVTIATAHATLSRADIVYLSSAGVVTALSGTPSVGDLTTTFPVPPAVPTDGVLLAVVFVAPATTGPFVLGTTLIDARCFHAPTKRRPWLTLPDGWDDTWVAAKAASGTTPATMLVYGDSMSDGSGTPNVSISDGPYCSQLFNALTAKYGYRGEFWPVLYSQDWWTAIGGGTIVVSSPWSAPPWSLSSGSGRSYVNNYGLGTNPIWSATTNNADVATFTVPAAWDCRTMELLYLDAQPGSWNYSLNGAAEVTVTNRADSIVRKITFSGLTASTQQQLVIRDQTAASVAMPVGMSIFRASTTGIQFSRCAWLTNRLEYLGLTRRNYTFVAPHDRCRLLGGGSAGKGGVVTAATNSAGTVTLTIGTGHGFATGDQVEVLEVGGFAGGVNGGGVNGTFIITATAATTINYVPATAPTGTYTSGGLVALAAPATEATNFGFPFQPHLAMIAIGINDCSGGKSATSFRGQLRRVIHGLRRGHKQCSIMIIAMHNPSLYSSDVVVPFPSANQWEQFLDAMISIANDYRCAFVDITTKWQETPVADGFCAATNPHPTQAGHDDIYALLKEVIV